MKGELISRQNKQGVGTPADSSMDIREPRVLSKESSQRSVPTPS